MNKDRKIIAGLIYLISIVLLLLGAFYQSDISFSKIAIGATLIIIPWVMCIISASRKKDNGILWIIFLVGMGTLAIPLYLLTVNETEN